MTCEITLYPGEHSPERKSGMKVIRVKLTLRSIGLLTALTPAILAQTQGPSTPVAPDVAAYRQAVRIADPQKKLETLEKFIVDFPGSSSLGAANQAILDTLIKNWPDRADKILAQANKLINAAPSQFKSYTYSQVAGKLADAGILLEEAEKFATAGLAAAEEELARTARLQRSSIQANLGRIYLKWGKAAEAQKILAEAYEANPSLSGVANDLATLAEKSGNDNLALEYLMTASLSGRMTPAARQSLESLYRKKHDGTLTGMDEQLDRIYAEKFPNPLKAESYKATAARTTRVVLGEIFTGSGCPPCVAADLTFDVALERYSRQELAVLMYHLHIPVPDPMTNPSTQARANFYGVKSVPRFFIDGSEDGGGGTREMTRSIYDRINPKIEKRLENPAGARINLDAALTDSTVKVKATVDDVKGASSNLRLQIALVEERLRFNGENGVRFHPMVVRSLAGPNTGGFALDSGKPTAVEHTFNLAEITTELKTYLETYEATGRDEKFNFSEKKHTIDPGLLSVVALVQDEKTKEILQSVYVRLKMRSAPSGQ
jgi:tetratricopeptide (TPR) repeat protein